MLSSTRQAVLSTLIARGVPFKEADELVRSARNGESFDATLQYALEAIARRTPPAETDITANVEMSIDYTTPEGRFTQRVKLPIVIASRDKLSDLMETYYPHAQP